MALDSLFLSALHLELKRKLRNSRVEKIYQPHSSDIVLHLRNNQENYQLLLSAHPQYARIHLTEKHYDHPSVPPAFCMLLRKYLENSRLIEIEQPDFERILRLYFQTFYPIDGISQVILVIEIMGKHSNIIFLNRQNNLILGAVKIISQEINRYREIYPGLKYLAPPGKNKLNPWEISKNQLLAKTNSQPLGQELSQILMDSFIGLSPLLAKEIVYRAGVSPDKLWSVFSHFFSPSYLATNQPTLLLEKSQVLDFFLGELEHLLHSESSTFSSPSALLDYYYGNKQTQDYLRQKKRELSSLVERELKRCCKKKGLQEKDLVKAEKAEIFKIKGELILANLYQLSKGDSFLTVANYYDPEGKEIAIELDPRLSPSENAQAFFKKYTKARNSQSYLQEQLGKTAEEADYLEGVLLSIEEAGIVKDLELIKGELEEEKYLLSKKPAKKNKIPLPQPLSFSSSDGLEILVGKNNRENDYLTLKLAHSQDIWLHVKDLPGSHVIIRLENKQVLPETTLQEAARLAAYYSKARSSSQVPVDYTKRKNIKKPSGAKPGMIIYEEQQTIYVTPDKELLPPLNSSKKQ